MIASIYGSANRTSEPACLFANESDDHHVRASPAGGTAARLLACSQFFIKCNGVAMNGEVDPKVHRLDEVIQSAVALSGEAPLRCLKYLWPRSRRYEPRSGQSDCQDWTVRSSPYGKYRGAPPQAPIDLPGLHGQGQAIRRQSSSWRFLARSQILLWRTRNCPRPRFSAR
jgi:hypothetical protein